MENRDETKSVFIIERDDYGFYAEDENGAPYYTPSIAFAKRFGSPEDAINAKQDEAAWIESVIGVKLETELDSQFIMC